MFDALKYLDKKRELFLILFLIIFYTVGTIGMLLEETHDNFLQLSFLNLILSFVVVLIARRQDRLKFYLFLFLCFIVGLTVELIGTKTGLLFGNYSYGENLGPKVSGVPVVIGLNWGILVVCSASLTKRLGFSSLTSAIVASLMMTGLDYLMEPIAIQSDYWTWVNGEIPLYNYICWFAVSIPLHYIYFSSKLVEANKVNDVLFFILIIFFLILNIF